MSKEAKDRLYPIPDVKTIPSEDIPRIELYMDQVTTFMDTQLADSKRYPDDKILTKTMINNYTKNHLLPPSVKKKYSREHLYLLILIYQLKNMLSITDIQNLIEPLTTTYFPQYKKGGPSLKDIYDKLLQTVHEKREATEEQIRKDYESSRGSFPDEALPKEEAHYLDDLTFLYGLSYEITVRKQLMEQIIDRRQKKAAEDAKTK